MDFLLDPQIWFAFLTLSLLEIVLGIDNIIFLSILVSRLPRAQQGVARQLGLALAMLTRIGLLLSITWVMSLTVPLFQVMDNEVSGRDLVLMAGGLFLLVKSTLEIHSSLEGDESERGVGHGKASLYGIILQIAIIDIVFSLDSVVTAVGLAPSVEVMIAAIVVSVVVMIMAAAAIGRFVDAHPTIKMLALSFLILIGIALMGEAMKFHIPKGYIYFAMAFSVAVEMLNIRLRRKTTQPMQLRKPWPSP